MEHIQYLEEKIFKGDHPENKLPDRGNKGSSFPRSERDREYA